MSGMGLSSLLFRRDRFLRTTVFWSLLCSGAAWTSGCGGEALDDSGGNASGGASASGGSSAGGTGASSSTGGSTSDDLRSCATTSECSLVSATCCGVCGEPEVGDVTSVKVGFQEEHLDSVCGGEPAVCPLCAQGTNPHLFAQCDSGKCEPKDLRKHEFSACNTAEDCILLPNACCECGAGTSPWEIVAINPSQASEYRDWLCSSGSTGSEEPAGCDGCLWSPPEGVDLACTEGHCQAVFE